MGAGGKGLAWRERPSDLASERSRHGFQAVDRDHLALVLPHPIAPSPPARPPTRARKRPRLVSRAAAGPGFDREREREEEERDKRREIRGERGKRLRPLFRMTRACKLDAVAQR
jgi:hypothetical protein